MIAQKPLPRSKFASVAERLFFGRYTGDVREITFGSADVAAAAEELGYSVVDQLSEFFIAYGFQQSLPRSIRSTAPRDFEWRVIDGAEGRYRFALRTNFRVVPDNTLVEYAVNDVSGGDRRPCGSMSKRELLDFVHANRLVEQFTGLRCLSRKVDVRACVSLGFGTTETIGIHIADLLFGESRRGATYVMPIYYVSDDEALKTREIELGVRLLKEQHPSEICLPLVTKGVADDIVVLSCLEIACDGVRKGPERRYRIAQKRY